MTFRKFRVWDKYNEDWSDYLHVVAEDGQLWHLEMMGPAERDDPERYVVEYYTGLKDKNGKEICEGDVVKYLSYRKEYTGQIVFDFVDDSEGYYVEKHYGWGIRRELNTSATSIDYNLSLGDYADDNMKCELVEVIGNIHKNPELLGGEK